MLLCAFPVQAQHHDVKPFPENRVRDFYARQAEQQLDLGAAAPRLLPEFPGLDGGAFGHWGQNPETNNTDDYRNRMDYGGQMSMHVDHFGTTTIKGVTVHLPGDASVLFDPLKLTFVDLWRGKLRFGSDRFGLGTAATPTGDRLLDLAQAQWRLPAGTTTKYRGYYRAGDDVAFQYEIGKLTVVDHARYAEGSLVRTLRLTGRSDSVRLHLFNGPATIDRVDSRMHGAVALSGRVIAISVAGEGVTLVSDEHGTGVVLSGEFSQSTVQIAVANVAASETDEIFAQLDAKQPADLRAIVGGGASRWGGRTVTTHGELGTGDGPYVIDTLTLPYDGKNPFGEPFRVGGFDFLPDGRCAVAMMSGDVWLVDGVDADLDELRWKRIAAGLYQPLGMVVQDGKILVAGRDQIMRLHDLNGDEEADFYECVTNRFPTGGGGAFVTELHADRDGALYFFSPLTGASKLPPGSDEPVVLGSGLRNSNGMGVSDDGRIVLATTQEGEATPATGIFEVRDGSYHGYDRPQKERGKYGYDFPLCFVPRGVDHSAGGLEFLPRDDRTGPLSGQIIGTSFGNCTQYVVLRETVGDHAQGAVVPLPGEFLSGAHRVRHNPHDGQLYVAGTEGWQSYARENGSLQRVRYVGGAMPLPNAIETRDNGLVVRFNCAIDPVSVALEDVFAQQWNYLYSQAYGSPEYSVAEQGRRGHDRVEVRSVHLLRDRHSVFVEIPQLHPVMQFHLHMRLKTADGTAFTPDLYSSIFHLGEPFTDFPGYTAIAKRRAPEFPLAEEYPRDPRLVRQEQLGKRFDPNNPMVPVEVNAVPGLKYQPYRLRVPPGRHIALTVKNTDVSMPHNFVLVHPDRLQAVGEGAMLLAADPRAVATHYAPDDPGVLALAPILYPNEQYTIYFDSPAEKGAYPFVCTFPGHWKVMQGVLYVLDENEEMPDEPAPMPAREFVREWKTQDLAAEAANLTGRSLERGFEMFHVAGCIKCHAINKHGAKLGPDLTEVKKRYQGEKLLQQILDPSTEIHKDYRTFVVITADGKVHTGLLVKDGPESIQLLRDPLKPEEIETIPRDDIDEMEPSPLSTMPQGLLMTLQKDEILDLLGFLEAGGLPHHGHGADHAGQ